MMPVEQENVYIVRFKIRNFIEITVRKCDRMMEIVVKIVLMTVIKS